MAIPQVAIVGRPNVGKSSIFNWLSGGRLAIVDDQPGVTRDRVTHLVEELGRFFELTDTGGMGIEDVDNLTADVERQITAAIDSADVVVFVVDSRSGPIALDEEVARRLRAVDKPIVFAANKTDDRALDPLAGEFFKLGFGAPLCTSTLQNRGREELLEAIVAKLPPAEADEGAQPEPEMKIAIVGRRNVGKSTFVNALAQSERMIVSEVPGTTRDSVDVRYELDGKTFIAIDTAGVRKTKSVRSDIEYYSLHRAQRSIRRADVVLCFFDAGQRISQVDKQLCKYISDNYKPSIFVVNKWDLMAKEMPTQRWADYLRETFPNLAHAPIAFITAKTGKNVKTLLNHAQMLFKQSRERITTGELNRLISKALELHSPPLYQGRRPKIYYATQVDVQPPLIVLVCNNPKAFSPQYRRFLLGVLHDQLEFGEVPIKLYFAKRGRDDERDDFHAAGAEQSR